MEQCSVVGVAWVTSCDLSCPYKSSGDLARSFKPRVRKGETLEAVDYYSEIIFDIEEVTGTIKRMGSGCLMGKKVLTRVVNLIEYEVLSV